MVTVSDRVAAGEAEDRSGPAVARLLRDNGFELAEQVVVADEPALLEQQLVRLAALTRLVVTTGGTGLSPRDRTPEATTAAADYLVPGLAEEMRRAGAAKTKRAVLSRGVVGVLERSIIVNLPGSQAGAEESLAAIIDVLPHALEVLSGADAHRSSRPS